MHIFIDHKPDSETSVWLNGCIFLNHAKSEESRLMEHEKPVGSLDIVQGWGNRLAKMSWDYIAPRDTRIERLQINAQEIRETEIDVWNSIVGRSPAWESQTHASRRPTCTAAGAWPSALGSSGLLRYTKCSSFACLPL